MRLQHLIIIFLVIMLPLTLIISQYTKLQIDTLAEKTKYDTALLSATFDTMAAFELNTINSRASSVVGEEIRDLEAVISTFATSLSSSLGMSSASSDYVLSYVPAMVFGLYDGYYIYAKNDSGKGNELKPYVYYTKTYSRGTTNITIAYSLDNYVTIYGTYNGNEISEAGYLVNPDDVDVSDVFAYVTTVDEERGVVKKVINPGLESEILAKEKPGALNDAKTEAQKEAERLRQERAKAETERFKITIEKENADKKVQDLENAKTEAEKKVQDLEKEKTDAETKKSEKEQEKREKENRIIELENEKVDAEGRVKEIEEAIKQAKENAESQERIDELEREKGEAKNKVKDIEQTLTSARTDLSNIEKELSKIDIAKIEENITKANEDVTRTQEELINARKDVEAKTLELGEATANLTEITNQLVEVQKEAYINDKAEALAKYRTKQKKSWVTYKGYDIGPEEIYENVANYNSDGMVINREKQTTEAMMYYYEAKQFTELYNKVIGTLDLADQKKLLIGKKYDNDPEDEHSAFMEEKINVMKDSITKNLNHALYNYEGGVSQNYQLPQLKGEDWEKILNNVSITAFLKDIQIGATRYNNYVVVNSTTNQKYNSAESISFIEYEKDSNDENISHGYYHKITCDELIENIEKGVVDDIIGYASVDFERYKHSIEDSDEYFYYYKHNEYADYRCEVETIGNQNVSTMEEYIESKHTDNKTKKKILEAYYKAVGRVRHRLIKASSYINLDKPKKFTVTYYPNGGIWSKGASETVTTEIGKLQAISETPRILGKAFTGWSTNKDATVAEVKSGDTIYGQEGTEIKLYAIYADQYTVTYNANGGEGGPSPNQQTKISGVDYIISTLKPRQDKKVFLGWSTNPSASFADQKYDPGSTYKEDQNLDLYAVWADQTVKIRYNLCGGRWSLTYFEQDKPIDKTVPLLTTRPYYPNNTAKFIGWSTAPGKKTIDYLPGDPYDENVSRTLYAVWDVTTYRIYFHANGSGARLPADLNDAIKCSKMHGFGYLIPNTKPERDGYDFAGWSTSSTAVAPDSAYAPGQIYMEDKNLDLYAVWQGQTYTVIYDANEGIGAPASQEENRGTYLTIPDEEPTREGYDFRGWSKQTNAKQAQYKPGDTYKEGKSVRLYAVWERKEYKITFDANGGEQAPAPQTKKHGEIINITEKIPKRGEDQFVGWSRDKDSNVIDYTPRQQWLENSSLNLFAVWRKSEFYSIKYYPNGGNGEPEGVTNVRIGIETTISSTKPTRDGYTFLGWSTIENAKVPDDKYAQGRTFDGTGDDLSADNILNLFAVWRPDRKGLTVVPNGGTWTPPLEGEWSESAGIWSGNLVTDQKVTIDPPEPVKGYAFWKWEFSEDSYDGLVANFNTETKKMTITMKQNELITMYARYREAYYRITYNKNTTAAVGNMPTQIINKYIEDEVVQTITLSTNIPTRTGYRFMGWSPEGPLATTAKYQPGDSFEMPYYDMELYAVWAKLYTLTYNVMGGQAITPDKVTIISGETIAQLPTPLPSTTDEKYVGAQFKGWSTNSAGPDIEYGPGSSFTMSNPGKNTTLYAIWEYTLTYNPNGGEGGPGTERAIRGERHQLSKVEPTREGYRFLGWSTNKNATSAQYFKRDQIWTFRMPNNNVTLYAIWTKEYTLKFVANRGETEPNILKQVKLIEGEGYTISSATIDEPTRPGYRFLGWSETQNASSATYERGKEYRITMKKEDVTLYAIWAEEYELLYNLNYEGGVNESKILIAGEKTTLPKPTRNGYKFLGWADSTSSTTATYKGGDAFTMPSSNTTLYAVWIKMFTLTYSANGGSGAPSQETYPLGTEFNLSTTKPERNGYRFIEWSLESGEKYQPGDRFEIDRDVTLYAIWFKEHTLTYNTIGGNVNPRTVTLIKDERTTLPKPSKIGAIFKGWEYRTGEETKIYQANDTFTMPDNDVTLYALWNYKLNYYANYQSGASKSEEHSANEQVEIAEGFVREGYNFLGWAESNSASVANYQPGDRIEMPANSKNLYAVWEVIDLTPPDIQIGYSTAGCFEAERVTDLSPQVTIQISDSSGISTRKCELNNSSSNIGMAENNYSTSLSGDDANMVLRFTSTGTYYLHVLAIDKKGNKNEAVSQAIKVEWNETTRQYEVSW